MNVINEFKFINELAHPVKRLQSATSQNMKRFQSKSFKFLTRPQEVDTSPNNLPLLTKIFVWKKEWLIVMMVTTIVRLPMDRWAFRPCV